MKQYNCDVNESGRRKNIEVDGGGKKNDGKPRELSPGSARIARPGCHDKLSAQTASRLKTPDSIQGILHSGGFTFWYFGSISLLIIVGFRAGLRAKVLILQGRMLPGPMELNLHVLCPPNVLESRARSIALPFCCRDS